MSADRIAVTPGQLAPSLSLVYSSALDGAVELGGDGDANLWFTVVTPRPSTGEALLLRVLSWLNGAGDFPEVRELQSWLDEPSLAAVAACAPLWVA